jgi:tRNA(Ile2) C34 agmatinyltransferase TiaS
MMIYLGMDDTDILESRGTGQLARNFAARLSQEGEILGVIRHQLFYDPRIPFTKNNSSACILLETDERIDRLAEMIQGWMLAEFVDGSDPGFCLASQVPPSVIDFGWRAKREVLTQLEAIRLAASCGVHLHAVGGDGGGIIGALAAAGLAASGEDGRYIEVGSIRSLSGLQPVERLLAAGISRVATLDYQLVESGMELADKLRPCRRFNQPVAFVEKKDGFWQALKID